MPPITRTCTITGQTFHVSELEQKFRQKFNIPLPDIHPQERVRYLMNFRNINSLYNDTCDLCHKSTLSVWGENPKFPVYCVECWHSDAWQPPQLDLDLEKPFFDQYLQLINSSPHLARFVDKAENSEFCNAANSIKSCYMSFNIGSSEDCYYVYGGVGDKNCVDTFLTDNAELLYDSITCNNSYKVFYSEFATHCNDSYFLYDCTDSSNCALSTGLRHKKYVFLNEQLTKEAYQEKIQQLETGSFEELQKFRQKFEERKKVYAKKYLVGTKNENSTGNILMNCKNVEGGYGLVECEDSVNLFNVWSTRDSLDVVSFGLNLDQSYSCTSVGLNATKLRYCFNCYGNCSDLEYCFFALSSENSFGCTFGKKFAYCILNKKYSPEEYKETVQKLKEKMQERGEYGKMFREDLIPFAYNESIAQLHLPLTKEEALKRGFRWVEKKIPQVPEEKIIHAPDNIQQTEWSDIEGKFMVCAESQRPFRITKAEFEFYKRFNIPLPRLHPEVRLFKRYPRELIYNLHEAKCDTCGKTLQTSMATDDKVLCETCYQEKI